MIKLLALAPGHRLHRDQLLDSLGELLPRWRTRPRPGERDVDAESSTPCARRDTRELYLIRVGRNVVREETLHAPDAKFIDADPLPYEIAIDDVRARWRRRA